MTGAAVTDLLAQREADRQRIREMLEEGLTARQIAGRLKLLEGYVRTLLSSLEERGEATLVCGIWVPAVIG
jgi:predicted ArsR family transcriptional regulator